MTENQAWQIFKNTGSVEAYLTFSKFKNIQEKTDGDNLKNKGDSSENKGYTG